MEKYCSTGSCSLMGCSFCPKPVNFVAGLIMFVAGLTKVLSVMGPVSGTAAFMGGAALGLIGVEAPTLALVLGWIAILIELVGGFVFMIGCCKTSKYAAVALAVVAGVIMILDIQKGMAGGFFKALMGAQFTILFFAVFAQSAWKTVASCCGMGCGSCCGTEMKK